MLETFFTIALVAGAVAAALALLFTVVVSGMGLWVMVAIFRALMGRPGK